MEYLFDNSGAEDYLCIFLHKDAIIEPKLLIFLKKKMS
jgi:hypothetical protein